MATDKKHALLTTIGTYGDLYPYLVLAKCLLSRGLRVTIATQKKYKNDVIEIGCHFIEQYPDWEGIESTPGLLEKIYHPKKGGKTMLTEYIIPAVEKNLEELLKLKEVDLLFNNTLTYATALAAEKWNIPIISIVLSPVSFFSCFDPPKLPFSGAFNVLLKFRYCEKLIIKIGNAVSQAWAKPIKELKAKYKLKLSNANPLTYGYFQSHKTLILLPDFLIKSQPDWPQNHAFIGFPFLDKNIPIPKELDDFIKATPRPLFIYTLGSSFQDFDHVFFRTAELYHLNNGGSAIFITGKSNFESKNENIKILDHFPYHQIFPYADAIIHQGGIGTIAECIRAGKPQLITPKVNDQLENARRCEDLGIAQSCKRLNNKVLKRFSGFKPTQLKIYQKSIKGNDFELKFLKEIEPYL